VDGRVAAFTGIGTSFVRLLIVRLDPDHLYPVLARQEQQVWPAGNPGRSHAALVRRARFSRVVRGDHLS
jgi:hypothetical protein